MAMRGPATRDGPLIQLAGLLHIDPGPALAGAVRVHVVPAHAGVIRTRCSAASPACRRPRPRGGHPNDGVGPDRAHRIGPADAGVIRRPGGTSYGWHCRPRPRRDHPFIAAGFLPWEGSSPPTRGHTPNGARAVPPILGWAQGAMPLSRLIGCRCPVPPTRALPPRSRGTPSARPGSLQSAYSVRPVTSPETHPPDVPREGSLSSGTHATKFVGRSAREGGPNVVSGLVDG